MPLLWVRPTFLKAKIMQIIQTSKKIPEYLQIIVLNASLSVPFTAQKIIAKEGQSFVDAVKELFEKQGGVANSAFGEVLLDKKGAKNVIKYGVGVEKNIAFAAVKDVLEKGTVLLTLDYYNTSGKKQKTGIIAAPISIGNEKYICAVEVIANMQDNRLYVHEAFAIKNSLTMLYLTRSVAVKLRHLIIKERLQR